MRGIKQLVYGLGLVGVVCLLYSGVALAGNQLCPPNAPPEIRNSEVCQTQNDPLAGPDGLISDITKVVSVVAGIAAVIMVMVGGFKYVTSAGESSKIQEAKKTIMWSAIGLVVIVLARSIILFVLAKV